MAQNAAKNPAGSADGAVLAPWHWREMSLSRKGAEAPTHFKADARDLPDWLRLRNVSGVGQSNTATDADPTPRQHALLTIDEVASHLRVSTRTVRRLIRSGGLQASRIGRSVRVSHSAVESLLGRDNNQ